MNIISGVVEHLRGLVFHWGGIKQAAFFSHSVFLSASLFLTSLLARSPAILSTFRVQRGGRKLAAYFTPPFLFVAIIALQLFLPAFSQDHLRSNCRMPTPLRGGGPSISPFSSTRLLLWVCLVCILPRLVFINVGLI